MTPPRITVRWLMIATALLAANLACLRAIDFFTWREAHVSLIVKAYIFHSLLMANALTVATPILVRSFRVGRFRPFLTGFVAAGWGAVVYYLICYLDGLRWGVPGFNLGDPITAYLEAGSWYVQRRHQLTIDTPRGQLAILIAVSVPQWSIATMGGLLTLFLSGVVRRLRAESN